MERQQELQDEPAVERDEVEQPVPEIWVGTAEDYAAERRYGDWLDATQRLPDLMSAVKGIMDRTPDALGKDWKVCDLRGFVGWTPAEDEGLLTVLAVARGISTHGPAYGALAARLGADSLAVRADKYPLSYLGQWDSVDQFINTVAKESGWYERLAKLPATMRPFVRLDLDALAAVARKDLTIIEHDNGVWVYDPRLW